MGFEAQWNGKLCQVLLRSVTSGYAGPLLRHQERIAAEYINVFVWQRQQTVDISVLGRKALTELLIQCGLCMNGMTYMGKRRKFGLCA